MKAPAGSERGLPPAPRVAVITARLIGDALLTTPLIHAARRRWPGARIEVLGYPGMLGMLEGNPDIDGCVELPSSGGLHGLLRTARRNHLWRAYDLALVTQDSGRAHMLGWFVAPLRAGLVRLRLIRGWTALIYAHRVVPAGDQGSVHVVDENLRLLAPWAGENGEGASAARVVPPAASALPPGLADRLAAPYAVVHAPSTAAAKAWPEAHFQRLVEGLLQAGLQVVLSGGPAEHDRSLVARLAGRAAAPQRCIDAAGQLDLRQVTGLLEGAACFVGTDTSITHLAAAVGCPVIALFGPTNPLRWAPLPAAAGAARFARFSPATQAIGNVALMQGSAGLETIGVARVLEAATRAVADPRATHGAGAGTA